jgi:hypothetical protein
MKQAQKYKMPHPKINATVVRRLLDLGENFQMVKRDANVKHVG